MDNIRQIENELISKLRTRQMHKKLEVENIRQIENELISKTENVTDAQIIRG